MTISPAGTTANLAATVEDVERRCVRWREFVAVIIFVVGCLAGVGGYLFRLHGERTNRIEQRNAEAFRETKEWMHRLDEKLDRVIEATKK